MQNSEVMMLGHGAFRDFKLIQKNTKKARRGDKEKTCGGGGVVCGWGVWFIIQSVYFSFSCKTFFIFCPLVP